MTLALWQAFGRRRALTIAGVLLAVGGAWGAAAFFRRADVPAVEQAFEGGRCESEPTSAWMQRCEARLIAARDQLSAIDREFASAQIVRGTWFLHELPQLRFIAGGDSDPCPEKPFRCAACATVQERNEWVSESKNSYWREAWSVFPTGEGFREGRHVGERTAQIYMDPPEKSKLKLEREPFRRVMKAALDDCLRDEAQ